MKNKVAIIGCGNVGSSFAYALLNQKTYVNELALIDLDKDRIAGEVMDLNHCLAFAPSKINIKVGVEVLLILSQEESISLSDFFFLRKQIHAHLSCKCSEAVLQCAIHCR